MKYLSYKDLTRRKLFKKNELEKIRLRAVCSNQKLASPIRFLYLQKLATFSKNSSLTRIKNRCIVTGRSQSVYKFFRLNRITLKEMISQNLINNVRKSSW
jgi:ribosomal protein S14